MTQSTGANCTIERVDGGTENLKLLKFTRLGEQEKNSLSKYLLDGNHLCTVTLQ